MTKSLILQVTFMVFFINMKTSNLLVFSLVVELMVRWTGSYEIDEVD